MSNTEELDKIISEGKVSPATAMVVFAVELKAQGDKIDILTKTITEDNKRYATKEDHQDHEKRISRIENAIIKFLVIVFIAVLGITGTVIVWALQQGAK